MAIYTIEYFLSALLVLSVGLYVYLKNKRSIAHKIFGLFYLSVSTWQFGFFKIFLAGSEVEALFWAKVVWTGVIFIPTLFYHFTVVFLDRKDKSIQTAINYFLSLLFLSSLWLSTWFIDGSYHYFWGYYGKAGFLQYPFMAYFLLIFGAALYYWHKGYIEAAQNSFLEYRRRKHVFLMASVGLLGAVDFLPNHGIALYPFTALPITVALAIFSYGIIKYQLMDIQTVIHKTAMWAAMSSVVLVPVGGLFYVGHKWIQDLSPIQLSLLVGALALLLIPYVKVVQPRIDHLFQRRKYDLQKIVQDFIHEIAVLKGLDELMNKLQTTISSVLYPERASIILLDVKSEGLVPFRVLGLPETFLVERHGDFLKWLERVNALVEMDLIEVDPRYSEVKDRGKKYFDEVQGKLVVPLTHDGKLLGVINLGQKQNLKPYTTLELNFLANLKVEASIAFSNSLLYDDVSRMSQELKQWATGLEHKVDERTKQLGESKRELEQSYQKLKELDHLKSQFFANISHELRTPLTLILAPLQSMLKEKEAAMNGERHRNTQIMHSNALRLLKLINNLLDLAKIDSGKMELYYGKGDLKTFIKGVVTSVSPMAEKKQIQLNYLDRGELPELYFDRDKIEKVMLNLIFNSLKFTNTGGKVEVSCIRENGHVLVKVSDTGIGIAKENHAKVFERFSQIDASDSKRYEGTGVGLALAKELVELHHGRIWVESEIGKGTTMAFTLPLLTEQDHLPPDRRTQSLEPEDKRRSDDWTRSLHTEAEYSGVAIIRDTAEASLPDSEASHGHLLLLVEDNPDMLNFLIFQLKEDYSLLTARDGQEGVQKVMTHLPDLVISDVMMPVKDGYQLCREIKAEPRTCHIPVILLTAKADLSMKIEGLQFGADDYLTKPFSSEELKARIKSLLHLRQLEREVQSRNEELQHTLEELKETQSQLVQSEKMAALGLLVAGVAHEINNPVSFAKASLSNLRRSFEQAKKLLQENQTNPLVGGRVEEMEGAIGIIKTGLERTEAIVNDLKNFVRKDQPHFRPTDLHQGLDSTLTLLGHELGDTIKIEKEYADLDPVETIPGQINQVFMNLLHNAIEAIRMKGSGEGLIRIKTWKEGQEGSHQVLPGAAAGSGGIGGATAPDGPPDSNVACVSIWDSGTGISKENQTRVFEPFFTTKEVGKGTGLGLAVTYRIIENHKGRIEFQSESGKWTEFIIALPIRQDQKSASLMG